ncbi:TPA: TM2 domain-containing protein [Streptococcus suis]|nr:TM2 domain-containing protein [Streptococcus suis]
MKNSSNSVLSRGMGIVCGVVGLTWLVLHFLPSNIFPATLLNALLSSYLIDIVAYEPFVFLLYLLNTLIFVLLFVFSYIGILEKQVNRYLRIIFLLSSIFAFVLSVGMIHYVRVLTHLLLIVLSTLIFLKRETKNTSSTIYFEEYSKGTLDISQQVQQFLLMNSNKFEGSDYLVLQQILNDISQEKIRQIYMVDLKDPQMVLICSLLFGGAGVDRFIIGDVGLGILKFITLGGLGIWTIIDCFLTYKKARRVNFYRVMEIVRK